MIGHTPGPWVVHQRPTSPIEYGHNVTTAGGLTVCSVTYQFPEAVDGKVVEARRIANARLIAAAPELLVALESMLLLHDCGASMAGNVSDVIESARAAIAKATGGQP